MEDVVLDSGIRDLGRERGKGWGGAERRVEVAKKGRGQWRRSGSSGSLTSSSRASGAAGGGGGGGGDVAYAGGGGGFVSTAGAGGAGVGNAVYRARTLSFYAAPPTPASGAASGTTSGAASGVASAPGAASGSAGAGVAPRSPLQQGHRGGYGQHRQQTQRGMAQQGLAQQGMGVAQQGMAQVQGSGGVSHVWRPEKHIPRGAVPAPRVPAPRVPPHVSAPRVPPHVSAPRVPSHFPASDVPASSKAPAPIAAVAPVAQGMAVAAVAPIQVHTPAAATAAAPVSRAAAGAAAARAAGLRGKREASREKDRHMVAFLLNMLTSLQPSPPSATPASPFTSPMPSAPAFAHPLPASNPASSSLPPSHPAVSPTHLGVSAGRLSMEEMLARLQQQWQAHRAGTTGTSKNGKKKSKKRAGAAAAGESSRNGQEEPVGVPTGSNPGRSLGSVRAFHVSEALKNLWDADAGLALFRWAKDVQGVKPDVYVYSTLFGLLGRGRDAANLARVVEEMREDGCEHNAVTLQSLATAYGRAGRWEEALATLGAMKGGGAGQSVPHDLALIGPQVDALFRMGRYSDAIKAFTELRSAGHVPDSFVYNTVLTCYGRVGNSAGAEEAFKDMIRHGVALDVRCANSLMDAYGRTGRVDDAMAVFDRMCLAAVAAGGASHMKGGGGGGLARERGGNCSNAHLPGAAVVAGIPPLNPHIAADNASTLQGPAARAITYSCAIHLLSMAGRLTEAEETFEAMLVAGMRPDSITWSTMVQMWAKEANPERAVMWFKRMVAAGCRPETPAYNSLMWAFVGRGMFDEAGEVLGALKHGWDLVGQAEKLVGRGDNLMGRGEEEQEATQGGSGKSVFGWLNSSGEGELGPGNANKGAAGAVSPQSKPGVAKLELAPNLMTYTMFLSECTESAARSDVARLLRLMEETEHAAHAVFELLTEEPCESTHTLLPAGAESDSESAPLSGAVCEAASAAGYESRDGETRRCEGESEGGGCEEVGWGAVCGMIERGLVEVEVRGVVGEWEEERWREVERRMRGSTFSESNAESQRAFADACVAFLHKFGRHERAARMWDLCHTRLRLYPCSIQLPAISGQGGECFVDLHGMSAGTAVTVTKWALEKMRQAVVASAASGASAASAAAGDASGAAAGASAASSSVASTIAILSTAANPTASGETAVGAIQGEEALVESLSPSESGAAESSHLHESPPAHPLQWRRPSKVAVVTGWGKRSRVQGASLVKAAVEALLLRDLTAPFSLHRFHPGSYEAPGADLEHWLLMPGARAASGAAVPEMAAAEAEKCDGGEMSWQRGPWDREGFSGDAGRAPGGRGRGRGRGGRGGRGGMGWQALERALRENEKDEILPQGRDVSAAAAVGGVTERSGRREAQRERDSTLVSVILNMLRAIQPPPPPTAPTGPTGARVMAVQRKGRRGRMGVDEMVVLLQQQWQNWLARSSSSSSSARRRHATRRSRSSKIWDEEGVVIGNTHWDEETTGTGSSSHRGVPFQAVLRPQGRRVTAYHVSEVLKAVWDADAGLALFRWAKDVQGVTPDAHVYSSLFGLLGRLKSAEGLEGLEGEMKEDGCGENVITLQALAAAYSRAGKSEEALATLDEIEEKDDSLSPFSFGVRVDVLYRMGRYRDGIGAFHMIGTNSKAPHNSLPSHSNHSVRVDVLYRMGRYRDVIKTFHIMREAGYAPDAFVYSTVLTCYGRLGNVVGAELAFREMLSQGMPLSVFCANSLMDGYGRAGRVDDAMAVFDRMCLAAVAARGGEGREGDQEGVPGAAAGAGAAAVAAAAAADASGRAFLNASGGLRVPASSPVAATAAGARATCTNAAAQVVTAAPAPHPAAASTSSRSPPSIWPGPDISTYSLAINLLSTAGRLSEAEATFEAMMVAGIEPDIVAWSTMVQMWAKEANPERAAMWFKRMALAGCRPETPAYNSLIWAFVSRGMFDEAGEVLSALKHGWDLVGLGEEQNEMQTSSGFLEPEEAGRMMQTSGSEGIAKMADTAFNPAPGRAPNLMTYTMFLSACTVSNDRSEVMQLMRLMLATEHPAHAIFQLLTEDSFGLTPEMVGNVGNGMKGDDGTWEERETEIVEIRRGERARKEGGDWEEGREGVGGVTVRGLWEKCEEWWNGVVSGEAGSGLEGESSRLARTGEHGDTRRWCEGESEEGSDREVGRCAIAGVLERGLVEMEVREVWRECEEERWREIERRMREDSFSKADMECQRAFADSSISFLHKFGRHDRAARMWDLCYTQLQLYPNSVRLPAIYGRHGRCSVDLHGMSAGTAVTVTRWALEKMRQAVVASAASGAASGDSSGAFDLSLGVSGETEFLSGAADSEEESEDDEEGCAPGNQEPAEESTGEPRLTWRRPGKVEVVTGWGKRSRVQGASLVKAVVEALLLRDLTAPFSLHRFHPGSYEALGADLEQWLLMPGVDQLLAPRDQD
ncbi:unnamed protein product [Closterium sp. NIES-65]|nr:unnamed protein product [Closterium sp. NIES-65]